MEDDVIRMTDHLGLERALLMGYSMGGRVSMGLLARRAQRLLPLFAAGSVALW